ncbi:uncharacterized protein LOC102358201 [Latimeria chalumnae]|uniref:uncharacterized protein LOC102358201 n=1 Tax=Latimeria chalumnae TaxID=7897 RepID=UPI0003C11E62|nr:PREDICTED: uncharacterized protein LOC102358201 [Latimeria chalumnae]|eukprot:XP_006012116.1 PREDICTED: uncharacterized protein LOC102358201 [Latimeria chalumnae]
MDLDNISWTTRQYSIKEFVQKFQNSFPKMIKVTVGFLGRQEVDSISCSSVLRVHSLYSQERAVAESRSGKILSLPTKLKLMSFYLVNPIPPKDDPLLLEEILSNFTLPVTIRSTTPLTYTEVSNPKPLDQRLEYFTISQTYKEDFLLVHNIDNDGKLLVQLPLVLPMYMKQVRLVVAEGFMNTNIEAWNAICNIYDKQVDEMGNMAHFICQEITLLDKADIIQHGNLYSEIEPIYIALKELNSENAPLVSSSSSQNEVRNEVKHGIIQVPSAPNYDMIQAPRAPMYEPLKHKDEAKYETFKFTVKSVEQAVKIFSVDEIPKELKDLDIDEVCDCLVLLNMGQYAKAFKQEQIDGQLLFDLDRELMRSDLGMSDFHITKLLRFREGWRPKGTGLKTDSQL